MVAILCAVAAFVFVLRTPWQTDWLYTALSMRDSTETAELTGMTPAPAPESPARPSTRRRAPVPVPSPAAPEPVLEVQSVDLTFAMQATRMTRTRGRTPVYSTNSAGGDIVRWLETGAMVETSLEVIDPEGRWTVISLGSQRLGFVRSGELEQDVR